MNHLLNLEDMRRQYGTLTLNEKEVDASPIVQFINWFSEASQCQEDANAMVLSTVDPLGRPDARVVLLKDIDDETFVFYTNYQSHKSQQIESNPNAALVFYWSKLARQVRIRGEIKRTSEEQSDDYFSSRPVKSQLSAIVSPQSQEINSRVEIEEKIAAMMASTSSQSYERPVHWGGYMLYPHEIEFFQGRDDRIHDRVHYYRTATKWQHRCLAP